MRNRTNLIVGGAALGAALGGVAGWFLFKQRFEAVEEGIGEKAPIDRGQIVRLGWNIIALLRQITELA